MPFYNIILTMCLQDDGLSAYVPKTMTNKKDGQKKKEPNQPMIEDEDEYEVEELINDPMIAMMPTSFGKQNKKQDLAATFAKTKRTVPYVDKPSEVKPSEPKVRVDSVEEDDDDSDSDDIIGPMPAEVQNLEEEEDEEEYDDDEDEFPVSHEIILKDHTKVYTPLEKIANDRLSQQ